METGPGLKMYFLLKMGIIHCYMRLPEGTKKSRNPIRFPWKIGSHLGLHSGRLRSSPSLGLPRKTSSSAILGEKSVKCMHPKSRCSQNPQKCFILAGNDSDFRFSNLQSRFGRAWRNLWNNILCFKNITFAQNSLHEKSCGHLSAVLQARRSAQDLYSFAWLTYTHLWLRLPRSRLEPAAKVSMKRCVFFPPRNQFTWWWSSLTNQLIWWFIPIICRCSTIFSIVLGLKHHCEPPSCGPVVRSQEPGGSAPRLPKKNAETPG